MATELKFSRSSPDVSWGFRIVGGADFNEPLIVVKVNEDSLAEQAGLQVGDLLVRINDTSTAGLTHAEAHDLLIAAGSSFVLGVRRGDMPTHIFHDENYNFDFSDDTNQLEVPIDKDSEDLSEMKQAIERTVDQKILSEALEIINQNNLINKADDIQKLESLLSENLSGQEEIVYTTSSINKKSISHGIKTDKKWSTFLMKPDKPIPKPQKQIDEEKTKAGGYKVVIQKQPSRRKRAQMQDKKVQFDESVEEQQDEEINVEENEEYTKIEYKRDFEVDYDVTVTQEEIGEVEDSPNISENDADDEVEVDSDSRRDSLLEVQYPPISQIKVNNESSLTLEDQLRAVQKQLEALAHLPSAIQITLDAVSKQLANIVSARESSQEKDEDENENDNIFDDNDNEEQKNMDEEKLVDGSTPDIAEAEENNPEEIAEDTNSNLGDELETDDIADEELKAILERNAPSDEEYKAEQEIIDEEERLSKFREEESFEKKKKAMENLREIVKPIGGDRRWSEQEDVLPLIFKKPKKMSEEKIFELIENNLEVISGNRKGINFKKFQQPTKNLTYLQHSEVYRMIHGMEKPSRGIVSRAEKIPAVQDYYQAIQGAP